jgi:hypothetical protein
VQRVGGSAKFVAERGLSGGSAIIAADVVEPLLKLREDGFVEASVLLDTFAGARAKALDRPFRPRDANNGRLEMPPPLHRIEAREYLLMNEVASGSKEDKCVGVRNVHELLLTSLRSPDGGGRIDVKLRLDDESPRRPIFSRSWSNWPNGPIQARLSPASAERVAARVAGEARQQNPTHHLASSGKLFAFGAFRSSDFRSLSGSVLCRFATLPADRILPADHIRSKLHTSKLRGPLRDFWN